GPTRAAGFRQKPYNPPVRPLPTRPAGEDSLHTRQVRETRPMRALARFGLLALSVAAALGAIASPSRAQAPPPAKPAAPVAAHPRRARAPPPPRGPRGAPAGGRRDAPRGAAALKGRGPPPGRLFYLPHPLPAPRRRRGGRLQGRDGHSGQPPPDQPVPPPP